jgi:hypothetical protein
MTRLARLVALATACAACWWLFVRPVAFIATCLALTAASYIALRIQDWRDQRRRAKAERVELPEMRWLN